MTDTNIPISMETNKYSSELNSSKADHTIIIIVKGNVKA